MQRNRSTGEETANRNHLAQAITLPLESVQGPGIAGFTVPLLLISGSVSYGYGPSSGLTFGMTLTLPECMNWRGPGFSPSNNLTQTE